jgi:hypothetical protein
MGIQLQPLLRARASRRDSIETKEPACKLFFSQSMKLLISNQFLFCFVFSKRKQEEDMAVLFLQQEGKERKARRRKWCGDWKQKRPLFFPFIDNFKRLAGRH